MRPPTLAEAIQNVMKAFPGTKVFKPEPHIALGLKPKKKRPRALIRK